MSTAVSIERLQEIAEEVMRMSDDFVMDTRLREVMMGRHSYECIELAMYLRMSYSRQSYLPTWQPLLNASVEMALMRGETDGAFYGLMPQRPDPQRNTGHLPFWVDAS